MTQSKTRTIPFRRKAKTNYRKRIRVLLTDKPRLVVRKSLKNIAMQIIEYDEKGDKVLASAHSTELAKHGWTLSRSNVPAAYLTGLLLGKKAKEKGITSAVLDIGRNVSIYGSKIYSALKGAVDAGLDVPHSPEIFPKDDRIKGGHIAKYSGKDDIKKQFEDVKNKVMKK